MKWLLAALALAAGCAKAVPGNEIVGGIPFGATGDSGVGRGRGDGGTTFNPDASPFDAPQGQVTLSETTSQMVIPLNAIACNDPTAPGGGTENTYFRVFKLSDYGITDDLHITEVDFGIQSAAAATGGMQPAVLQISPYTGTPGGSTLDTSQIGTAITSLSIEIADTGSATVMKVPITADVPAGSTFVVVLDVAGAGDFYFGTNATTETQPGYIAAPDCDIDVPTSMQQVATNNSITATTAMVMSVTGTR